MSACCWTRRSLHVDAGAPIVVVVFQVVGEGLPRTSNLTCCRSRAVASQMSITRLRRVDGRLP